jgi:hypothetical protein
MIFSQIHIIARLSCWRKEIGYTCAWQSRKILRKDDEEDEKLGVLLYGRVLVKRMAGTFGKGLRWRFNGISSVGALDFLCCKI